VLSTFVALAYHRRYAATFPRHDPAQAAARA